MTIAPLLPTDVSARADRDMDAFRVQLRNTLNLAVVHSRTTYGSDRSTAADRCMAFAIERKLIDAVPTDDSAGSREPVSMTISITPKGQCVLRGLAA